MKYNPIPSQVTYLGTNRKSTPVNSSSSSRLTSGGPTDSQSSLVGAARGQSGTGKYFDNKTENISDQKCLNVMQRRI